LRHPHVALDPSPKLDVKEDIMRKLVCLGLLLATTALHVGCVVPIYSADPAIRARQLIYMSENLRMINEIWERIWFLDVPDTETPYRTHGGVI
jgi:hypothetical protein